MDKQRLEVIALTAWADYCKSRRRAWSERNYTDHIGFASPGGEKRKRAKGDTIPGPLHSLLNRPLALIDGDAVRLWLEREAKTRPARALLGFRLLRAFINWCVEDKEYAPLALPHLTLHGLRRSFGTLSEWCEVPVGVVAQIQGHKPSAIAEKHYRVRPVDLLRVWHEKIEAWVLEQAGIEFKADQPQGLRVVAG